MHPDRVVTAEIHCVKSTKFDHLRIRMQDIGGTEHSDIRETKPKNSGDAKVGTDHRRDFMDAVKEDMK